MGEARGGERILVVEPESDLALVLEALLQDEGYRTEVARSLPHVPSALAEPAADLIILDVYYVLGTRSGPIDALLPVMAGKRVPVLCLSTDARSVAAVAGNPLVAGTLVMPFDIDSLLSKVRAALDSKDSGGGQANHRAA